MAGWIQAYATVESARCLSSISRIFPTSVSELNGFGTKGMLRVVSGRSSAFSGYADMYRIGNHGRIFRIRSANSNPSIPGMTNIEYCNVNLQIRPYLEHVKHFLGCGGSEHAVCWFSLK
jgi:hypothetical protein